MARVDRKPSSSPLNPASPIRTLAFESIRDALAARVQLEAYPGVKELSEMEFRNGTYLVEH